MKKLLTLTVIFLLIFGGGERVLGQPFIPPSPSTPRIMIDEYGNLLSDSFPLPVKILGTDIVIDVELGDISLETIPSFEDTLGSPTRALLDGNLRQMINYDDVLAEIASLSLDIDASKTAISAAVGDVETAVGAVETEIASGNISINDSIQEVKVEVASVSGDVGRMETTLSTDIASVSGDIGNLDLSVRAVETEVASGNISINDSVQEVKGAVDTLAASVDVDKISDFSATVITVSAETGAAIVMPDLGTARVVYIFSDKDVNFGGSGVGTGDAEPYIPGGAPFVKFRFSTNTPAFYFRGRAETASIRIWAAEE